MFLYDEIFPKTACWESSAVFDRSPEHHGVEPIAGAIFIGLQVPASAVIRSIHCGFLLLDVVALLWNWIEKITPHPFLSPREGMDKIGKDVGNSKA